MKQRFIAHDSICFTKEFDDRVCTFLWAWLVTCSGVHVGAARLHRKRWVWRDLPQKLELPTLYLLYNTFTSFVCLDEQFPAPQSDKRKCVKCLRAVSPRISIPWQKVSMSARPETKGELWKKVRCLGSSIAHRFCRKTRDGRCLGSEEPFLRRNFVTSGSIQWSRLSWKALSRATWSELRFIKCW